MAIAETARMLAQADYKDNISAGVAKSIKSVDKLERRFQHLGSQVSKGVGSAIKNIERLAVVGIAGGVAAVTYTINKAVDWETAMAGVNKTLDATPDELKAIETGIISMSNRMPIAATELAGIAEAAGALGVKKQDVLAFVETVALIGTTTDVSVDQAATAIGQLTNVVGLLSGDYDNFAASLVALGNAGASTESQILEIERRSGSAAKLIGIATDVTLGWSSAAANLGINQELAGTSLQNFFLKSMPLYTNGSKVLQKITGETAAQLKKSFKQDASGALESLLKDLGQMPKDARLAAVQKLFGKGSGLTRLVIGLADSVDKNLTPSLDTSTTAWKESSAASEEAQKRYATTASQMAVLKNNVDNAAVTIGTNLLPVLNELAKTGVAWITANQGVIKQFGQDLAKGVRDAVTWARKLDWDSIGNALKTAAGFAKGIVDAFLAMPAWVQTAVITGWGLNKLTGGALGSIVSSLASGLIKGVLGINAGVVNINAASVVGGGGAGIPGAALGAAGAAGGIGAGGTAIGTAVGVGLIVGPIVQQLSEDGANAQLAAAGIKDEVQAMASPWDFPALLHNLSILPGAFGQALNPVKSVTASSGARILSAIHGDTQSTARNLDQVTSAIRSKKLAVKVTMSQSQRQAINAAISGTGPIGKKGFHYTSSEGHKLDISRVLAKGAVGLASSPTPAIFGEAGPEAFAILRNPRSGTLGGGPTNITIHNVVVLDPRRMTKKQTSNGIYKTFVST